MKQIGQIQPEIYGPNDPNPSTGGLSQSLNLRQRIMAKMAVLLSHYYIPGVDRSLEASQAIDWANDLSKFSFEAVEKACEEWRKTQGHRPKPNEMVKLCAEFQEGIDRRSIKAITNQSGASRGEAMRRWKEMFVPGKYYPTVDDLRRIESELRGEDQSPGRRTPQMDANWQAYHELKGTESEYASSADYADGVCARAKQIVFENERKVE